LRPPETLNHKKNLKASLVYNSEHFISSVAFSGKIVENLPPKLEVTGPLLNPKDFVHKYSFSTDVWTLFKDGVTHDRSAGLMALGYYLAEMNLTNPEILAMLVHADDRWGKFSKRNDQIQRLIEIVTKARQKYPFKIESDKPEVQIISIGDSTLISTEVNVEWLWNGMLHETGYMLLTGHTGVGKSQFSLNLGAHIALGRDFLGREIISPKKVGFLSLEMGIVEVKYIRELQRSSLSEDDKKILEKNFRFHVLGYPLYLNRDDNKFTVEDFIQREGIELLIFDSLGSMTEQELSKETDAKNLMDWNDHLRSELGISTLIIHHHRKAQTGNKRPNSISDIYGSHYFTARATSVIILWESRKKGLIEVTGPKIRLAPPLTPFAITRQNDLTFAMSSDKLVILDEEEEINVADAIAFGENETTEFDI